MRARTVQIIWHDKQAVFSVSFNPTRKHIFSTSGGDNIVNEWELVADQVVHKQSLTRHTANVNVIRYSKDGVLATAGDDGIVFVWKQQDGGEFKVFKVLRVNSDVYDLCWSAQDNYIVTGSVDGCIKVFNVQQQSLIRSVHCHSMYIQGVAIDPFTSKIASLSNDRTLAVYGFKNEKLDLITRVKSHQGNKIYENEELNSFFRRPAFSPDGQLLLTPSGISKNGDQLTHCVYGYHFEHFKSGPYMLVNNFEKATVCVKFSPLWYKSDLNQYKFIYGVATLNEIVFYSTESELPLGLIGKLHYAGITDFSWSVDGEYMVISSGDGFCSIVQFDPDEFGERIEPVLPLASDSENAIGTSDLNQKLDNSPGIDLGSSNSGEPEDEVVENRPRDLNEAGFKTTHPINTVKSELDGSTIDLNSITTLNVNLIKKKR